RALSWIRRLPGRSPTMLLSPRCAPFAFLVSSVFADGRAAQTVKLNDPFLQPVAGFVEHFLVSSSGNRGVFVANQGSPGARELFGFSVHGGVPVQLGSRVGLFDSRLSADGSRVSFVSFGPGAVTLRAAPTDGSSASIPLVSFVGDFDIFPGAMSSDGAWVVYRDWVTSNLLSVDTDGSQPPIVLSPDGLDFKIDSNSTRVVFRSLLNGVVELYSIPIDGSANAVTLSGPLAPGGGVRNFELDVQGTRVVYTADQETAGTPELYSVPIDGSAIPVKLNRPLAPGGTAGGPNGLAISGDGARAIFLVR